MKRNWTRRKFLEASLTGSIIAGGGVVIGVVPPEAGAEGPHAPETDAPSALGLDGHRRELLRATMDEIIPAGDGMPAASAVGSMDYLDRLMSQSPEVKKDLEKSLGAVEELSRKQFGQGFVSLSRADRVEALKKLETQPPQEFFVNLRDYVYEAYYTHPEVGRRIGYEFHPTNQAGPRMEPFDESVLARVKRMPKLYREAP